MTVRIRRLPVAGAALVTTGLVACAPGASAPEASPSATAAAGQASVATDTGAPTPSSLPPAAPAEPTDRTPATATGNAPPGGSRASVSLEGPNFDAPGALLPMVVTASGTRDTETVTFTIALADRPGTCEGRQWRHAGGVSQSCWVILPAQPGPAAVTASADVAGSAGTRRASTGTYSVTAAGPPAHAPSAADRDRITTCGNTTGRVWLTFDDGFPSTAALRAVVDTLTHHNVKGRFFGVGQWARAHPQMVAEIRRQGHLVHNHTSDHSKLHTLGDADLRAQIAGGPPSDSPRLLRPGYGMGAYTDRVVSAAGSSGHQVCYWTVDPRDWADTSAHQIISRVMEGDHKTPPVSAGGVVLLHMTGAHTAQALPGLIAALNAQGLTVDPLR